MTQFMIVRYQTLLKHIMLLAYDEQGKGGNMEKKQYIKPTVELLGDVQALTQGSSGPKNDGGGQVAKT